MGNHPRNPNNTERARSLRRNQTRSEGLLWSILRAKQLCGLTFRRQHPIGLWIADFACSEKKLVVEIDGGYHDETAEEDLSRQKHLQSLGWTVIRFTDEDVERNAEAVGQAIAKELNIPYKFKRRKATASGMKSTNAPKKRETR